MLLIRGYKRIPRRKLNRAANANTTTVDSSKTNNLEFREPDDIQPESLRVLQQVSDDETRALQVEVTSLLEAVQQTETKMVEMSALNHLISTHVLQQAQQIELLYEQAPRGRSYERSTITLESTHQLIS